MRKKNHKDAVWYPFTQMKEFLEESPLSIAGGKGCWLTDEDGNRYLDGISSLWANVHGHRHPVIDTAIKEQIDRIAHSTMLGLTHEPGVELAGKLVQIAPEGLERVFYSDSGSTSVEIALKMAYQYFQLKGQKNRCRFLKLGEAYHGDTIGSVSLGGIDVFHERFGGLLFENIKIPTPHLYRHPFGSISDEEATAQYFSEMEKIIKENGSECCALIIEPLIQGAAGMIMHPPGYLKRIRELTKELGILLICDEVAVGFGRTGKMFASDWEGVSPDLMCIGKGITGGYLPLAATLATEEIFSAYLGDFEEMKTFYHGHTYTGNPLACSAAIASLEIFREEKVLSDEVMGPKIKKYSEGMERLLSFDSVGSVRFKGLMGGAEIVRNKSTRETYPFGERIGHKVIMKAREKGVMLRPLGDVINILPPLSITLDELDILFEKTEEAIKEVIQACS